MEELHRRLKFLTMATRVWAAGGEFAERSVDAVRHQALLLNHRRYAELIPAYRRIADDVEVTGVEQLVHELLVTTDLFKSYDPVWLEDNDFGRMTEWLGTIFVRTPGIATEGVGNVSEWRKRLFADHVHLTTSSGTTGRPSFVPRDPATLNALRHNGTHYPHPSARGLTDTYDSLLLVPPGEGMGLQGVAAGLAGQAQRTHRLDHDGYAGCVGFLRSARRPVLVFGPPFALQALVAEAGRLPLEQGSVAVIGGGWKGTTEVSFAELRAATAETLAIDVVDVYSTSELNAAMMTCEHGHYHVPPLLEARVVDDDLFPLDGDDVTGVLAFLDPFALSYPGFLVTGDVGRLVRGRCECGKHGVWIIGPITRSARADPKGCAGVAASVQA
jgi:hypothetical protein